MGLWSWVKSLFGFTTKKAEEKEIEEERVEKGELDNLDQEIEKTEEEERLVDKEIEKEKERQRPLFTYEREKIKERVGTYKGETEKLIPVQTRYYQNVGDLSSDRYNIYRNLIQKAIRDDNMAQKIYLSGLLDDRIVCIITLGGYFGGYGDRAETVATAKQTTITVQGLTPDKVLNSGLLGMEKGVTSHKIMNLISRIPGVSYDSSKASNLNVSDVEFISVRFDFA